MGRFPSRCFGKYKPNPGSKFKKEQRNKRVSPPPPPTRQRCTELRLSCVSTAPVLCPLYSCPNDSGISLSAVETSRWWKDLRFDDNSDWEDSHAVIAVILIVAVVLIIAWHFAEAWKTLPGAYYVSGQVNINIVIKENLHRIYNVSRGLIVSYALLYAAFAFESGDGFEQHYILLAWVLSLVAQFKSRPSVVWLALSTGVFIQGIGAHRLAFLCHNMGRRFVEGDGDSADSFGDSSDSSVSNDSGDGSGDSFDDTFSDFGGS